MMSRFKAALHWIRRHPIRTSACAGFVGIVALNGLAYQQARAMMWFANPGARTQRPERLSGLEKIQVLFTGIRVPRPENTASPADFDLPFETLRIPVDRTVTVEAWSIPAESTRGTVVLFHGYAAAKEELLPEARRFHGWGYTVWLVDFRGSGGSSERYTTIGYLEAEDVAAAVQMIRSQSRSVPVILYGRSMGAAAVLRAIRAHDVSADAVILESVFDKLTTTAGNRFQLMGLPAFPGANLLVFWGGVAAGFPASRHNPVDDAPACHAPTLMLHGELDLNARIDEGQRVLHQLGDRHARLIPFPNTGHSPTLQADPEKWQQAIQEFFSERLGH